MIFIPDMMLLPDSCLYTHLDVNEGGMKRLLFPFMDREGNERCKERKRLERNQSLETVLHFLGIHIFVACNVSSKIILSLFLLLLSCRPCLIQAIAQEISLEEEEERERDKLSFPSLLSVKMPFDFVFFHERTGSRR